MEKTMELAGEVLRKVMKEKIEREWVGLSDTEAAIYGNQFSGIQLAKEIEAALRSKNNG
jgi:hypothetical protein